MELRSKKNKKEKTHFHVCDFLCITDSSYTKESEKVYKGKHAIVKDSKLFKNLLIADVTTRSKYRKFLYACGLVSRNYFLGICQKCCMVYSRLKSCESKLKSVQKGRIYASDQIRTYRQNCQKSNYA